MIDTSSPYSINQFAASQAASNKFDMSFKTSDGDEIKLNMYDNKSLDYSSKPGESSMSLSHSYGYSFSYSGNGLSEQDKKEIQDAMAQMKPMLDDYYKSVEDSNSMFGGKPLSQIADQFKSILPDTQGDTNKENAVKSNTLDTFDSMLKNFADNDKILKSAKDLFDQLFSKAQEQANTFYA